VQVLPLLDAALRRRRKRVVLPMRRTSSASNDANSHCSDGEAVNAIRSRLYRRLETDDEFRARLADSKRVVWTMKHAVHYSGVALDDFAEEHYRVHRRIVEVDDATLETKGRST
jgi:hypothetical protein